MECGVKLALTNVQSFQGYKTHVSIVMSNLIRNAHQYTTTGKIRIKLDGYVITISNQFDNDLHTHANKAFGFGIGLYLVKKICTDNNWMIQTDTTDSIFSVKIQFKNQTLI